MWVGVAWARSLTWVVWGLSSQFWAIALGQAEPACVEAPLVAAPVLSGTMPLCLSGFHSAAASCPVGVGLLV